MTCTENQENNTIQSKQNTTQNTNNTTQHNTTQHNANTTQLAFHSFSHEHTPFAVALLQKRYCRVTQCHSFMTVECGCVMVVRWLRDGSVHGWIPIARHVLVNKKCKDTPRYIPRNELRFLNTGLLFSSYRRLADKGSKFLS